MNIQRLTAQFGTLIAALVLAGACTSQAHGQAGHPHGPTAQQHEATADEQNSQAGALLKIVREATERFKDVNVAMAEGYLPQFGCVTGPDAGAMGLHFINGPLVMKGDVDAQHPQIVIYEPLPNGQLKLIGADFLVFADDWNKKNQGPPQLMGQLFHLFDAPNRFGLPAFYTLHVWAWKDNPNGAFVNWHPNVSCAPFSGQVQ